MNNETNNFCKNCGFNLEKGNNYCSQCGTRIVEITKKKSTSNDSKVGITLAVLFVIGAILYSLYIMANPSSGNSFSSSNKSGKNTWTLFVYDQNKRVEEVYYEYKSLSLCWDGAVTGSQRGRKYFECGRNCDVGAKTTSSCDYICPQWELDQCEKDI